ncbi:MAG: nucleoid-associated protein [Lentisphaeria bacterium]
MNITDVKIDRIIVHEALRASEIDLRTPILSNYLVVLDDQGKALVGKRLVNTVSSGSQCVDVSVDDGGKGSPFDIATEMLDNDEKGFIDNSKKLAYELSRAQTAGPIKAGSAIFIQGSCFADAKQSRFLAIIKADSDQAFQKHYMGDSVTLTYVSDMLLGESQRLIKIAFIIEITHSDINPNNPKQIDDFTIKVFDHLMHSSGNGNAATYFYSTFLRCKLAQNASWQTKLFYEVTKSFIETMPVLPEDRITYYGDVISYLRQNRSTIDPRTFALDVLPYTQQDAFIHKCMEANINQAFTKDTRLIIGKLRRQSVRFSSNVTLYAPSEVFRDAVKITGTSEDDWTELKIRGSIEKMP